LQAYVLPINFQFDLTFKTARPRMGKMANVVNGETEKEMR